MCKKTEIDIKLINMKGILIYDTSYGHNKIIAETIAEILIKSEIEVDVYDVKDVKKLQGKDYDFLILGSPTRMGRLSFKLSRFISSKMKEKEWKDKPFAAFGTNLATSIEEGAQVPQNRLQEGFLKRG